MSLCYLNGSFLPLAEAQIPVLDRGFIFGDGVYEVIPAFGRRPFRLDAHLRRLDRSLGAIGMRPVLAAAVWTEIFARLLSTNEGEDQTVYVHITRGVAPRVHAPPPGLAPTVFVMSTPLARQDLVQTVSAVTHEDFRWQRCDIKSISLLGNVLLRQFAVDAGAHEAILLRDGQVTEGASSNVFVVHDGQLYTPPHSHLLLPGVTRDLLVELLADTADAVREAPVTGQMLRSAAEIWLSSSGRELAPVVTLDGRPVGAGSVGEVYRRVLARYLQFKAASRAV
jgi:D-alanine transaminase